MRKRYIKSVAHWVIMTIVLLFPILMVGISSFAQKQQEINVNETYEYQTNDVNSESDLIVGNIYKVDIDNIPSGDIYCTYFKCNRYATINYELIYNGVDFGSDNFSIKFYDSLIVIKYQESTLISPQRAQLTNMYVVYSGIYGINYNVFSASDYLGEKTIDYTITDQTMRDDVNEWCSSFRNLPVNQWYGEMLDTIGLGITNSMMMNVIYTYPLYVLWVYIIDLLVDCLLVIINFGHNALKRLGGDNE